MATKTRLVPPQTALEASYRAVVAEFHAAGEPRIPWVLDLEAESFEQLVNQLGAAARGVDLPQGFVSHSTYWLVDENDEVLAVSNLRHRLTPDLAQDGGHIGYGVRPSARGRGHAVRLLALTLEQARKIGLGRVMLTCDQQNRASASVIAKNGGLLEEEYEFEGRTKLKYWIDLDSK